MCGWRHYVEGADASYISDLLPGSFVRLQAQQDALRVLEDGVDLVPHLALFFGRLCV